MKNLLVIFLLALLAACSTKNEVTPDAGSVVAGVYPLSYIRSDSAGVTLYEYNLPASSGSNSLSGSLTARRDSASVVLLTQTIKLTGYADQTSILGSVNLRSNGSGYDMYVGTQKVGTADGTSISIDATQTDVTTGTIYRDILTAKKAAQ